MSWAGTGVVERSGNQIAFAITRDGSDVGVEADGEGSGAAFQARILDHGALDRNERLSSLWPASSRSRSPLRTPREPRRRTDRRVPAVTAPVGFEHHPVRALRAFEKRATSKLLSALTMARMPAAGAVLIDQAAAFAAIGRDVRHRGDRLGAGTPRPRDRCCSGRFAGQPLYSRRPPNRATIASSTISTVTLGLQIRNGQHRRRWSRFK
jgi:hypothetical protein